MDVRLTLIDPLLAIDKSCNDKVFSSMLYMKNTEQRGSGIENGSKWSNGTVHFDLNGSTVKFNRENWF